MKYGLIGEKLGHSYSCEIHAQIGGYDYELKEIEKDALDDFFARKDFLAINVTIPYKQSVIPYLDCISDEAKSIGAVNTIVNDGKKLCGYNTDYYGIKALCDYAGISVNDKKVLVLGTGGTAKTATAVFRDLGAKDVVKVSRTKKDGVITYAEAMSEHCDASVIFNATPVGMYPNDDNAPILLDAFKSLEGVLDAIYHPLCTNLVLDARARGIKAEGGLYMLAAQAVYASKLFMGESIECVDNFIIEKAYKHVLKQKKNIVLVGMPSSGKSSVGEMLAKALNREFYDTDVEIEKRIVMSIADYFEINGEQSFREIESEIINSVSKESGVVIATGGGSVLNCDNVNALKRNGVLVFLDRALESLISTSSRPLSSDRQKLQTLFEQRYDLYSSVADVKIDGNGGLGDVVDSIVKELQL